MLNSIEETKNTVNMLRKLSRKIWCSLVKSLLPCRMLQRHLVKRRIYVLRRRRDAMAEKTAAQQMHARLMANPSYRCRHKTTNFLRYTPRMWSFVELAAAHYNTQIDRGSIGYRVKPDIESKLDIAQDYFIRDRAGLVEWWCKFTKDGQAFLDDEHKIMLDMGIPFHDVLVDMSQAYGIEVKPDCVEHLKVLTCPCMDVHGNPNIELMAEVASKARVKIFED